MARILVTGGAGYIGSHTVVQLLEAGHDVTVVDNLCNSSRESIKRVEKISGKSVDFQEFDLCDGQKLGELFKSQQFEAVIHFAGLKAVGESVAKPLKYYRNNIGSTLSLCEAMQASGVKKLIFSSSATVYGTPNKLPLTEESPVGIGITNPYGQTKYMIEQILRDVAAADPGWNITILRYFNPVGAHKSGLIGEDPTGIPSNLLPNIAQMAVGKQEVLNVWGDDYDTPDGTCIRDYIHVVDLAKGHLAALDHLKAGVSTFNLGTGKGVSVLQAIRAFEVTAGKPIPYVIKPRRPGDVAASYADASKAAAELDWHAEKTIEDACKDAWNWQSHNPKGYNEVKETQL